MITEELKRQAENFWQKMTVLKLEKFPNHTWSELCSKADVNYSTFRSSKSNCSIPSASNLEKFSKLFGVHPDYLLNAKKDKLATRKRVVSDAIYSLDESTFLMIERMLALTPKSEDEKV